MSYYLDTSAIVPIFVDEPSSRTIVDLLAQRDTLPNISDYSAGEFASAISRHVRMKTFPADHGRLILEEFDRWTASSVHFLRTDASHVQRASQIVRQFDLKLRFSDALQIALCEKSGLPFLTRDVQMENAATTLGLQIKLFGGEAGER